MNNFRSQVDLLNFLFGDCVAEYNSTVFVGCLNGGMMRELRYPIRNVSRIASLKYVGSCDYYVTANSVKVKNGITRTKSELYGLHNICIDIDLHNSDGFLNQKIFDNLRFFIVHDLELPLPNVFVRTGRGVQLWWHFVETSSKLLFMYQSLTQLIINRLNDIILAVDTLSDLKIDTAASRNVVGYFRLPFTINTKSNTMATAEILTDEVYNLIELFESYCDAEYRRVVADSKKSIIVGNNRQCIALISKRKRFVEEYCANRDYNVTGSRDLVMFLYCVNLVQLVSHDFVMGAMKKLNSQFGEPLEQSKLDEIFGYLQRKGVLKFKDETFLDFLPFTISERAKYYSSKNVNATRDAERKTAKEERNRRILELATQGQTTKQIADTVGCSSKTVKRFLQSQNFSRAEDNRLRAISMHNDGASMVEISKYLNVSERAVKYYLMGGDINDLGR